MKRKRLPRRLLCSGDSCINNTDTQNRSLEFLILDKEEKAGPLGH